MSRAGFPEVDHPESSGTARGDPFSEFQRHASRVYFLVNMMSGIFLANCFNRVRIFSYMERTLSSLMASEVAGRFETENGRARQ